MICSVLDIRRRLGGLMEQILTKDFAEQYASYQAQLQQSPESVMKQCADRTDRLVQTLSSHLHNRTELTKIMHVERPDVLFTFFTRYHFLTQYLVDHSTDAPANMPDDDSAFFIVLLTDFWTFALRR